MLYGSKSSTAYVPTCEPAVQDAPAKLMLSNLSSPGNGRVVDLAAAKFSVYHYVLVHKGIA